MTICKSDEHYERIEKLAEEIANEGPVGKFIQCLPMTRRDDIETGIRWALQCIVDDKIKNFKAIGFDIKNKT